MAKKRTRSTLGPPPADIGNILEVNTNRIKNTPLFPQIGGMGPGAIKRNDLNVERPGKEK